MECPPLPPAPYVDVAPAATCLAARSATETPAPSRSAALPRPAFGGEKSVFDGDFLIVGAGAVALPAYEGADETAFIPAAGIAGRIGGVGISPRAAGVALDLLPDRPGARIGFNIGPVVRLRLNRTGRIKDPAVASLGKLRGVIEGGVAVGVTVKRVLNPHDQLSAGVDLRWDISGRGGGGLISPAVSYLTPVSRAQVVGLLASAEFADRRFAEYNYGISPAGSAASGLPAFAARGGLKALNFGAFTARDLDGNLLNGGFAIGVGGMYTRLKGSAARTPMTALRGSRNQWVAAAGLGFTF
jgi:MipA family protein